MTDTEKPRMRGVKRASKIRKLFNLSKEDDVRDYVITYKCVLYAVWLCYTLVDCVYNHVCVRSSVYDQVCVRSIMCASYRRSFEVNGKKRSRCPKIQRLVTPRTLQRKRRIAAIKKSKHEKVCGWLRTLWLW